MSQAPSSQPLDADRLRRRASFDSAAELYEAARPAYPEELFDDLVTLTGLHTGSSILEVGSGTGKATFPLARRGFHILGIELGENLAALARAKLADYPQAQIGLLGPPTKFTTLRSTSPCEVSHIAARLFLGKPLFGAK
jgi:cyclopropane fatty-acyl-phospholipid synthase-like methyltransferase